MAQTPKTVTFDKADLGPFIEQVNAAAQAAASKLRLVGIGFEVLEEVERAVAKHGPQAHPDGTGKGRGLQVAFDVYTRARSRRLSAADAAREICDGNAARGPEFDTWEHILTEEFFEALEESEWTKLRAELIQVAAMAMAWIADGDSREVSA